MPKKALDLNPLREQAHNETKQNGIGSTDNAKVSTIPPAYLSEISDCVPFFDWGHYVRKNCVMLVLVKNTHVSPFYEEPLPPQWQEDGEIINSRRFLSNSRY